MVDDGFGLICVLSARFVLIFDLIYATGVVVAGFVLIFFYCGVGGFLRWLVWFEGDLSSKVVLCPFDLVYSPSLTINCP